MACLRSPPCSPSPNHPSDVAGNPDASRCFVGRDSDRPAPHGSPDRGGWPGSAARPHAGRRAAPSVHSLVRSKSGRGHSGCRQKPELGSARTETGGQSSPPATAHMDPIGNDWNTAPACVLSTVWGTASVRDLAVEVGAVPASPIRQVLTSRQASCAGRNSPRARKPVDLWTTRRGVAHKPTGPTTAADNLNLEISSLRTTPGSHSQAALLRPLPPSIRGSSQPFTSPPNTLRLARRTRRVLVPARYAPAISASAARVRR